MSKQKFWTTRNPQRLSALRMLERAIREGKGGNDARWYLINSGLTRDEVYQIERTLRHEADRGLPERGVHS